ncbi:unnamed protein product, partial [Leptidea sinapis]
MGSAGTTAASTLARAGRRVLALEAQDRIGGRVKTIPFGDGTLGVDNHIDLRTHNTSNNVVKSDGSLLDRETMIDLALFCLTGLGEPPKEPVGLGNFTTIRVKKYLNEKYPALANDEKFLKDVTQIKWPRDASGNVEVVCKDGSTYTASNVIVTVSLGVLKEIYATLFSPDLPQTKIFAIDNISFGAVAKVILSFSEVWWSHGQFDYLLWWNEDDLQRLSDDEKWISYVAEISTPAASNNTVTLWFTGDRAKLTPLHPHIRDDLAAPLVDAAGTPRVLFAGEATSRIHFATVHGASETGKREALRLLQTSINV